MNDKQLDQLFRQGLGDYEAPPTGAGANWQRLQGRTTGRRQRARWWLWGLLALLGGSMTLALGWQIGGETPAPPLSALARPVPSLAPPWSAVERTPPVDALLTWPADASVPSPQAARAADSPAARTRGQGAHPAAVQPLAFQDNEIQQAATDSDDRQPQQALLPLPPYPDSLTLSLPASSTGTPLPAVASPQPWRWLPRIGGSLLAQRTSPNMYLLPRSSVGLVATIVEKSGWSLQVGALWDHYRQGFLSQSPRGLFSLSREVAADDVGTAVEPGPGNAPAPGDTVRRWQVDAPGLLLPLSLRYTLPLRSRWQPFVAGDLLLRYQVRPSLGYRTYTRQVEADLPPNVSPVLAWEGEFQVVVPPAGEQGWHHAGWQVSAGTRLRLRPHLSAELAAYYQTRAALDLPQQAAFETLGLRLTLWWER